MVKIDLSAIAPALEILYTDTMDIYGYTGVNEKIQKAEGIGCRVSFGRPDSPDTAEIDRDPVKLAPKIICGVGAPATKGDFIIANKRDRHGAVIDVYEGHAGLPAVMQSHQEFEILQGGQA